MLLEGEPFSIYFASNETNEKRTSQILVKQISSRMKTMKSKLRDAEMRERIKTHFFQMCTVIKANYILNFIRIDIAKNYQMYINKTIM